MTPSDILNQYCIVPEAVLQDEDLESFNFPTSLKSCKSGNIDESSSLFELSLSFKLVGGRQLEI